ncbi:hypothetical protein [Terrarubrum flagellatum]|uniref:hypothetical protein n=1 Tax=Terrirubrum flagellatum TaxID=2895980 RepID=UPI003144E217
MLEDIARAFVTAADRDPRAAETFADIATALIPRVEMSTAVAVARLLAGCKDVPAPVLAALAARGLKPRGAKSTPTLPPADIWTSPDDASAARDEKAPSHASFLPVGASAREKAIADAARLAALDSGPELRRTLDSVTSLALARAAERRDGEDAAAILARVVGLGANALAPAFIDPTGESLAILLKAAGLTDDEAIRLLVGVGPTPVQSGAGLKAAMRGFRALDRATAIRLLSTAAGAGWSARPTAADEAGPRRGAAISATISPSLARPTGAPAGRAAESAPAPRASSRERG